MKKCPFCGADIEDSARFCLYCMQPLTEKEQILPRQKKKPQWLLIIAAIVAILVMFLVFRFYRQPAPENTPSTDDTPSNATTSTQTEPSHTQPVDEPPHIHSYLVENTAAEYRKQAANCTTPAVYYYSCQCGEKSSETFPYGETADHIIVTERGYPATCNTPGLTDGTHCSVCDTVFLSQTQTPVVSHTYDNDQDENCNLCNYVRVLNCNHAKTVKLAAVSPTCTAGGLTEGKKCSLCEEILVAQTTVAPLGHTAVTNQAITPTCTTGGKTEGKHCATCNTVLVAQVAVAAKGHTEVVDPAVAATCTTGGKTEGKHCSLCQVVLVYQQNIPAQGHSFSAADLSAPCSRCGAPSSHIHSYTEKNTADQYLRTAATCTSQPTYYYSCLCGAKSDVFFHSGTANGHTKVKVPGYPADCTNPGLADSSYCSVCNDEFDYAFELPALGHTFDLGASNATCLYCGINETMTIEAPQFPLTVYGMAQVPFRIDRVTYAVTEVSNEYRIEFIFYGTNLSSNFALFSVDASLYGEPYNQALGCAECRNLDPNQSGIYRAIADVLDPNGTYTLVFY